MSLLLFHLLMVDYSQAFYSGLSSLGQFASDAYNTVAQKASEVDWDSLSTTVQQKSMEGWDAALGYVEKAKTYVGGTSSVF